MGQQGLPMQGGLRITDRKVRAFNRTGADIVAGSFAALNKDLANATYAATDGGDTDFRRNAVAITVNNQLGQVLIAAEDIPQNKEGLWHVAAGQVKAKMPNGTAKGNFFSATAASTTGTAIAHTQAALDALSVPTRICGRALEANATGADALVFVEFDGLGADGGFVHGGGA